MEKEKKMENDGLQILGGIAINGLFDNLEIFWDCCVWLVERKEESEWMAVENVISVKEQSLSDYL